VEDALAETDAVLLEQPAAHHAQRGLGEELVALLEAREHLAPGEHVVARRALAEVLAQAAAQLVVLVERRAGEVQLVEALRARAAHELLERVDAQVVVAVEEHDVLALRAVERDVAHGREAAVLVARYEREALVARDGRLGGGARAVGGRVVHHERLEVGVGLPLERRDAFAHVGLGVEHGYDHRHGRRRTLGHGAFRSRGGLQERVVLAVEREALGVALGEGVRAGLEQVAQLEQAVALEGAPVDLARRQRGLVFPAHALGELLVQLGGYALVVPAVLPPLVHVEPRGEGRLAARTLLEERVGLGELVAHGVHLVARLGRRAGVVHAVVQHGAAQQHGALGGEPHLQAEGRVLKRGARRRAEVDALALEELAAIEASPDGGRGRDDARHVGGVERLAVLEAVEVPEDLLVVLEMQVVVAFHDVGVVLERRLRELLEHREVGVVVGLDDAHVAAARLLEAAVHGVTVARVGLRDDANARVALRPFGEHPRRGVGGAVVNRDDLEALERLLRERLQALPQVALHVVHRHEHRYQRFVRHIRPSCLFNHSSAPASANAL